MERATSDGHGNYFRKRHEQRNGASSSIPDEAFDQIAQQVKKFAVFAVDLSRTNFGDRVHLSSAGEPNQPELDRGRQILFGNIPKVCTRFGLAEEQVLADVDAFMVMMNERASQDLLGVGGEFVHVAWLYELVRAHHSFSPTPAKASIGGCLIGLIAAGGLLLPIVTIFVWAHV